MSAPIAALLDENERLRTELAALRAFVEECAKQEHAIWYDIDGNALGPCEPGCIACRAPKLLSPPSVQPGAS